MTRWTDERLGALLTETFAAHEPDADPTVAQHIALTATPAQRNRWPLVATAAATAVLAAGVTASVLHPPASEQPGVVTTLTPGAEGDNRRHAAAEAVRLLSTIPVPPGATRSRTAPARALKHLSVYAGPVDQSLTRTNWWIVPLDYRDLVTWYESHSPADTSSSYTSPSASTPEPAGDLYWPVASKSDAYSEPAAVVSYTRLGPDTTAIRTDVTLAARYDRVADTLVPGGVSSIDITQSELGNATEPAATRNITDPTLVAKISDGFNDLDGAFANTEPQGCFSPSGVVHEYTLTFHGADHTLVVDPGSQLCHIGMGLTLDSVELAQKLEHEDAFDRLLSSAFDNP